MENSTLGNDLFNVLKVSIFFIAVCFVGCEKVSTPVPQTVAPVITVPGTPAIGTATAGDASASVTFTPPADDGGSPITGYTISSSGGITAKGSSSPITVTGLQNGKAYTFAVKATNAVGTSVTSGSSNAVTPSNSVISLLHANGFGWKLTKWEEQPHPGDPWNTFILSTCDKNNRLYFDLALSSRTVISDGCTNTTAFPNVQTWALSGDNTRFLYNGYTSNIEILNSTTFQILFSRDAIAAGSSYKYLTRLTYTAEKDPSSPFPPNNITPLNQSMLLLNNNGRGWKWTRNECQFPAGSSWLDFTIDACQTNEIFYFDLDHGHHIIAPPGCIVSSPYGLSNTWALSSDTTEVYLGGHTNRIEALDNTTLQISSYYDNLDGFQNLRRLTFTPQ